MRGSTNASNVGGTVGSDTKPLKSVNGVLTPVTNALISTQGNQTLNGTLNLKNNMEIDAFHGSGEYVGTFEVKNAITGYSMRLVLSMRDDNTAMVFAQKFDNNGVYLGASTLASF